MFVSTDPATRKLRTPARFPATGTLSSLAPGILSDWVYPGFSVLTPFGMRMRDKAEALLSKASRRVGIEVVQIPQMMLNTDLARGQEIGDQFSKKLMHLSLQNDGYHLLSTPEMMFDRYFAGRVQSYRDLPIGYSYHTNMFRNMPYVVPMLKERQIRLFGFISMGFESEQWKTLLRFAESVHEVMIALGVKFDFRTDASKKELYFDHPSPEGETRRRIRDHRQINIGARIVELAMGYIYPDTGQRYCRYRSASNHNAYPVIATFGLGTTRLLYAICNSHRDDLGFKLPVACQPFQVSVIPSPDHGQQAREFYDCLNDMGIDTMCDDRTLMPIDGRVEFAGFLGVSVTVAIDRSGIRLRTRGDSEEVRFNHTNPTVALQTLRQMVTGPAQ